MEKVKVEIKKLFSQIFKWVKSNKTDAFCLGLILFAGAFFRLYKIGDYMTFLGDEGRDAIIVRRFLVEFDLMLIGPRTSIGDMYLGPLYYYLIAPALLMANLSPVGPSVMVAIIGVATIFLVFHVANVWFAKPKNEFPGYTPSSAGWIAAFLFAISPVVIIYSRSSWNPNVMPFFSLLVVYSVWKVWYKGQYKWMIVTAICFAFILQSHYLGLILIPVIALFLFLKYISARADPREKGVYLRNALVSGLIFILLMSPLVIFDARHGWRNFASASKFFTERQTTVSAKPWTAFPKMWPMFEESIVTRIVTGMDSLVGKIVSWMMAMGGLVFLVKLIFKRKKDSDTLFYSGIFVLLVWMISGLVGMGIYKQHIYDHYFGFMYPALFLFLGALFHKIYHNFGKDGKIFTVFAVSIIALASFSRNPLKYNPNYQMNRAIEVAKKIAIEAKGKEFNLGVIAERNYKDGYKYFLEKDRLKVVEIDPQILETIKDQLFVVCELPPGECDPVHDPSAEIANFGWSKIEKEWGMAGVIIYKLVHSQ